MPAVSRRQQRYLFSKFGSAWVHKHGFDVLDTSRKKKKKRGVHHTAEFYRRLGR